MAVSTYNITFGNFIKYSLPIYAAVSYFSNTKQFLTTYMIKIHTNRRVGISTVDARCGFEFIYGFST